MPQRIVCEGCGYVLYESMDLKPPDEVIEEHGGRCPKCGKELNFSPSNIKIKPAPKKML